MLEQEMYDPVKNWLESKGMKVQAEVEDVDVVGAIHDGEDVLLTAVELKTKLCLDLFLQAVERLKWADVVYVGLPHTCKVSKIQTLCKSLGIGILTVNVRLKKVSEALAPTLHEQGNNKRNKKSASKKKRLMAELQARRLSVNIGGKQGRKMTAYREEALAIAFLLAEIGQSTIKEIKKLGVDNPTKYLYQNPYDWFERVSKGIYTLSPIGKNAVEEYQVYQKELNYLIASYDSLV